MSFPRAEASIFRHGDVFLKAARAATTALSTSTWKLNTVHLYWQTTGLNNGL